MRKLFLWAVFTAVSLAPLYAAPLFTPTVDGIKDAGWGLTPDVVSPDYKAATPDYSNTVHFVNPCRDLYITDDPINLYIGYFYNGSIWLSSKNGQSARIMFGVITNSSGITGGTNDPWEGTTAFDANNRPDFFIRQWTESTYDERMEFGGAFGYSTGGTKGVAEFLKWDGTNWVGAGSIVHAERLTTNGHANNWGEIMIPLSTLGLKTGSVVKVFYYYRPSSGKPGFSDCTPWDSLANGPSDNADGTSTWVRSNYTYIVRSDNIAPVITTNFPAMYESNALIGRATNIVFQVADNVGFTNSNISVQVLGDDAIQNGVFVNGLTVRFPIFPRGPIPTTV